MHPPFNLHLSTQTPQITASSTPQQQVMPSNHLQGYSSNSLLQIHPQLATTIDPRIPNLMIASNQPFPFQNGTPLPLLGPRAPVPHLGQQFLSEFLAPQNLNSTATNQNYYCRPNDQSFAVNSLNLAPMPMRSQFIPVNYTTHFVPQSQVSSTGTPPHPLQNANYIPRQQLGPGPMYPPLQHQAQNFLPIFIDPQNPVKLTLSEDPVHQNLVISLNPRDGKHIKDDGRNQKALPFSEKSKKGHSEEEQKQVENRLKWNAARSGGGADEHNNKMKGKKRKNKKRKKQQEEKEYEALTAGKGGFNCNLSHLLNVCLEPRADEDYRICLRCGDSGHSTFSCNNGYSPDDLKQIKCYICNEFGHLCCAEYVDEGRRQISCYKCGELGHLGPGCPNGHGHSIDSEAASLCDTCGEKGHIAINCQKNDKKDDDDDECV